MIVGWCVSSPWGQGTRHRPPPLPGRDRSHIEIMGRDRRLGTPHRPERNHMAGGRSSKHRALRSELKPGWQARNAPCGICGQQHIDYEAEPNTPNAFEMDHILPRSTHPHLEFEPSNCQPSAHRCNRIKNAGAQQPGIGITSEAW